MAAALRVNLSEVLSALSYALDLTEGQAPGHSLRTCVIGMRIGQEIGLGPSDRSALYYALLLKDAGCSSNAARMAALFATDDRTVKPAMKLADWHQRIRLAITTARQVGRGLDLGTRVRQFLTIAQTQDMTRDLIRIRCERGAGIATRLGFPAATADAIRSLDEHWVGLGYPDGRREEDIPVLARIALLAQTIDAFRTARGLRRALAVVRARRGTWFDPALVRVVDRWARDAAWWRSLDDPAIASTVVGLEPADRLRRVDESGLDTVASAFADIIDAKSPYTFRHSTGVAAYAARIACTMGVGPQGERRLMRAGLLHDIGKLGVSNRILDKQGPLTPAERSALEQHPVYTANVLARVAAFAAFARTAALHHEKLDGSGYPWAVDGARLDLSARILTVADMYEALTAERPYRAAMAPAAALNILGRDVVAGKLDASVVEALAAGLSSERVRPMPRREAVSLG